MPANAEMEEVEPLAVRVVGKGEEKESAADWGSWQTYTLTPSVPAQQILAQNDKRKNAYIIVYGAAGPGAVLVGTRGQVMNGQGGALENGTYKYEAKQELWAEATAAISTATVVVLDHRYA